MLPVFRVTRIGKSLELIASVLADARQLRSGFIDVRFSIIGLDQKLTTPFRAMFTPNLIVPYFQGYQSVRSFGELQWSCMAMATLAGLVASQMSTAFSSP